MKCIYIHTLDELMEVLKKARRRKENRTRNGRTRMATLASVHLIVLADGAAYFLG